MPVRLPAFAEKVFASTLVRYGLVGLANSAVGYGTTLVFFLVFGLSFVVSTLLGNLLGLATSFVLNRTFTFDSKSSLLPTLLKFCLSFVICYSFAYFLAAWLFGRELLGVTVGAVLYTVTGYLVNRYFVFPTPAKS